MNSNSSEPVANLMSDLGRLARDAAGILATSSAKSKSRALEVAAKQINRHAHIILDANAADIETGKSNGLSEAMLDRLFLDQDRLKSIATSLELIAGLPDPVGEVISAWDRPNGLKIERVRTPLGVVGVIYESRPNVTADAGALCLKAGNAVILRGGSDSVRTNREIFLCLEAGLESAGLPSSSIQLVPTTDRAAVGEMLQGLGGNLDVLVPRGGKSLVARVQSESRVPVFAHLEGICHVYLDGEAELEMAKRIVVNSKMRRTGICGAAESLLIDSHWAESNLVSVVLALQEAGCEVRGDVKICELVSNCKTASIQDWSTEYLDAIISVKIVDGVEEAIAHINRFGSGHTESIVTENVETANEFMSRIDSAILLHNASTQFADGGEFGMGAEIGIATGKMHARGPVGVEQLTSFNYRVKGSGQTRS